MYTNNIPLEEQWIHWEPIDGLKEKFYIDLVKYNCSKLIITLSDRNNTVKIKMTVKHPIIHYNRTNESFCITLFLALSNVDFGKRTFFEIKNSSYLKNLKLSINQPFADSLKHFCLISGDEVIHIVVTQDPEIKFMNKV